MPERRVCPKGHGYWWPAAAWQHEGCVANTDVANQSVANIEEVVVANRISNPETFRVQAWREANRDRYNARQRELMKRKRARRDG